MCTEKIYNRFMKNALGSIAILGSGETSPNLVSVHKELLEILDNSSDAYMIDTCLLYTSPSPRDATLSRMPSSA